MGVKGLRYVNMPWGTQPCFSSSSLYRNERRRWLPRLTLQTLQSFINQLWAESVAEAFNKNCGGQNKWNKKKQTLTQF